MPRSVRIRVPGACRRASRASDGRRPRPCSGVTASPYGQAASSRLSRVSSRPVLRRKHSSRANSRGLSATGAPPTLTARSASSRTIGPLTRLGPDGRPVGSPGEGAQAGRELLVGKWLDQVVVSPGVEAADPILDGVTGGQDHDRQVGSAAAQVAQDLEARPVGQSEVEDHGVKGGLGLEHLGRLFGGPGQLDDMAIVAEQAPEHSSEPRVVLDDKDVHGRTMPPSLDDRDGAHGAGEAATEAAATRSRVAAGRRAVVRRRQGRGRSRPSRRASRRRPCRSWRCGRSRCCPG